METVAADAIRLYATAQPPAGGDVLSVESWEHFPRYVEAMTAALVDGRSSLSAALDLLGRYPPPSGQMDAVNIA